MGPGTPNQQLPDTVGDFPQEIGSNFGQVRAAQAFRVVSGPVGQPIWDLRRTLRRNQPGQQAVNLVPGQHHVSQQQADQLGEDEPQRRGQGVPPCPRLGSGRSCRSPMGTRRRRRGRWKSLAEVGSSIAQTYSQRSEDSASDAELFFYRILLISDSTRPSDSRAASNCLVTS